MQSDLKVRAKPTLFKQTGSCFDTTNIQTIKVRDPPLAAAAPRAAIESVLGVPMALIIREEVVVCGCELNLALLT